MPNCGYQHLATSVKHGDVLTWTAFSSIGPLQRESINHKWIPHKVPPVLIIVDWLNVNPNKPLNIRISGHSRRHDTKASDA